MSEANFRHPNIFSLSDFTAKIQFKIFSRVSTVAYFGENGTYCTKIHRETVAFDCYNT